MSYNPFRPFPARRNPTVGGSDAASTTARASARRAPTPAKPEKTSEEALSAEETASGPVLGVPAPPDPQTSNEAGEYTRDELEALDRDTLVAVAESHGIETYRVRSTTLVDELLGR